jgi:hypothetical protein
LGHTLNGRGQASGRIGAEKGGDEEGEMSRFFGGLFIDTEEGRFVKVAEAWTTPGTSSRSKRRPGTHKP